MVVRLYRDVGHPVNHSLFKSITMDNNQVYKKTTSPRAMDRAQEFARAASGSRLVCAAFAGLLAGAREGRRISRLNERCFHVIQGDRIHGLGDRTMQDGDLSMLEGFDFVDKNRFYSMFRSQLHAVLDTEDRTWTIEAPAFAPREAIYTDIKFDHFVLTAGVAALDFIRERSTLTTLRTPFVRADESAAISLRLPLASLPALPLVLVLGMEYYQIVNGRAAKMGGSRCISLHIAATSPSIAPRNLA